MLSEGTPAPEISVPDHDGQTVTVPGSDNSWVLLWWYPKASTPG